MIKERLKNQVEKFIVDRLEDELWSQGADDLEYSKDTIKLMGHLKQRLGENSAEFLMILTLSDLYSYESFEMQQKAYKVGLQDGLNIKNVF